MPGEAQHSTPNGSGARGGTNRERGAAVRVNLSKGHSGRRGQGNGGVRVRRSDPRLASTLAQPLAVEQQDLGARPPFVSIRTKPIVLE